MLYKILCIFKIKKVTHNHQSPPIFEVDHGEWVSLTIVMFFNRDLKGLVR
jgi:hypothetical protein